MSLPRDAGLTGEDAGDHASVKDEDDRGDRDPEARFFDYAAGEEEAEVSEDESARADVIGRAGAEGPDGPAPDGENDERGEEEDFTASDENDAAEDEEGQRVRDEMPEAEVEEGRGGDAEEAVDRAGLDPEIIE